MKRVIYVAIVVAMLLMLLVVGGSAEEVTANMSHFANVPFSNGYYGFCIDHPLDGAMNGDRFATASDTSVAKSNVDGSDISQKLKILFTQCFDDIFVSNGKGSYHIESYTASSVVQTAVWHFSDGWYIAPSSNVRPLIDTVNAYDGPEIPDDGYTVALESGDYVTFHFRVFEPKKSGQQSFFAYKVEVSKEAPHVHDYDDEWSTDDNEHWHECDCGDKTDKDEHTFVDGECSVCEDPDPDAGIGDGSGDDSDKDDNTDSDNDSDKDSDSDADKNPDKESDKEPGTNNNGNVPSTGDNSNIGFVMILMFAGIFGLAVTVRRRKSDGTV